MQSLDKIRLAIPTANINTGLTGSRRACKLAMFAHTSHSQTHRPRREVRRLDACRARRTRKLRCTQLDFNRRRVNNVRLRGTTAFTNLSYAHTHTHTRRRARVTGKPSRAPNNVNKVCRTVASNRVAITYESERQDLNINQWRAAASSASIPPAPQLSPNHPEP